MAPDARGYPGWGSGWELDLDDSEVVETDILRKLRFKGCVDRDDA